METAPKPNTKVKTLDKIININGIYME